MHQLREDDWDHIFAGEMIRIVRKRVAEQEYHMLDLSLSSPHRIATVLYRISLEGYDVDYSEAANGRFGFTRRK